MNIVKLQNDLKDLSDQQLLSTMQSGASPQYLVLAEMQRRKKMRDEAATPNEPQAQGTVADEIMGGIAAIPMGSMDMASGGLVSFAEGGEPSRKKKSWEVREDWLKEYRAWLRGGQKGDAPVAPEYYEPGLSDYLKALPGGPSLIRFGVLEPADFGVPKYDLDYDAAIQSLSSASPEEVDSFFAQRTTSFGSPGSMEEKMRANGMYDLLMKNALRRSNSDVKGYAKGGYAKGELEACWTNPETGERMCPSGKPDVRKPITKADGGLLKLLPEDPVADAYTYLQSRGAEIPADMSEQGIIDYANRVRALDENEVKDTPETQTGFPALIRDYGSGGRGEVMPETRLDTAPQMPMGGGEYAPGFSPVAPTQEGLPGLLAPEGPAPERAVPFLGQVMENIVPSAQAAEGMPPVEAGLSADEARQIMKENAPSWYDVGGRSDVQVIGDAMKLLSGGTGTRWEEEAEKERIAKRDAEKGGVGDAISNMFGRYTQPNPFLEASGVAPVIAGQTVINAASGVKSDVPPSESTPQETTPPPATPPTEPPKTPTELPELPKDEGEKELTGREAYFDYLLKRRKGLEGREKDAANQALMAMGLSMMASKNPDFLGALGEGGIKGLEQYSKAEKEREEQILDLLKEEGDIYAAEAMYGTRQGQLGVSAFDKAAKILESKYSGLGRAQTRAALKAKYPNATPDQIEKALDRQYMLEVEALAARMQGTGMGGMPRPPGYDKSDFVDVGQK